MLSTLKLLKTGRTLNNFLCYEGIKGLHIQVISSQEIIKQNRPRRLLRQQQAAPLLFPASIKFASTDSTAPATQVGTTATENVAETIEAIPDPPVPPPPPVAEQAASLKEKSTSDIELLQELGILPKETKKETITGEMEAQAKLAEEQVFDEELPIKGPEMTSEINCDMEDEIITLELLVKTSEKVLEDLTGKLTNQVLNQLGEPTFESVGLGGWSPVGMVQNCMEFLHVTCDLPWWGSIAIGTLVVRILLFPLVIMSQRNAAKMNNHLPEMQRIQLKLSDARERGDRLDAARYAQELMVFMSSKGLNPLKNMMVPLAQAPFFISFFMGIRGMASLPVESMRDGGLFWFADLTVPDQFYLLPIITSATLALTIELGVDTARLNSSNMGAMKYILRGMPFVVFPFILNFPAGILVYWTSSNFISLCQVAVLRIPRVREFFKIDKIVKHDKSELPIKDKGFVKGVKESWTNIKISKELEERERVDEINFMRAGKGAVKKTFKFDPTQPRLPRTIHAKKRDE